MAKIMKKSWKENSPIQKWWRPNRVEYREGFFTFSSGDRYLPSDVFENYRELHGGDDISTPYVTLVRALDELDSIADEIEEAMKSAHSGKLTRMDKVVKNRAFKPLIAWIKANGPLGILLHETRRIVHPAVRKRCGDGSFVRVYAVDFWVAGKGWQRIWVPDEDKASEKEEGNSSRSGDERTKDFFAEIALISSSLEDNATDLVKFIKGRTRGIDYLEQFFPNSYHEYYPDTPYPAPLSDSFLEIYQEPVNIFLHGAYTFRHALQNALENKKEHIDESVNSLIHLSSPSSIILKPGYRGGQYELTFSSPSLLSAMAVWANADIISKKTFFCKKCGKIHYSPATKSLFCSNACKQAFMRSKKKNN